jgi:hypothetical protein
VPKGRLAPSAENCLFPLVQTANIVRFVPRTRNERKHVSELPDLGLICNAFEIKKRWDATTFSLLSVDGT